MYFKRCLILTPKDKDLNQSSPVLRTSIHNLYTTFLQKNKPINKANGFNCLYLRSEYLNKDTVALNWFCEVNLV